MLALELDLSARTIYRDVHDLMVSGVPVRTDAGDGYSMGRGYGLPPLDEIAALVLGARIVNSRDDGELVHTAEDALAKIEAVGIDNLTVDISELAKAEDAVTCCTLLFEDESQELTVVIDAHL